MKFSRFVLSNSIKVSRTFEVDLAIEQKRDLYTVYRRPGFNCESIINANYDLSLRAQLLERNYYYTMIDSMHVTHVLTPLCSYER